MKTICQMEATMQNCLFYGFFILLRHNQFSTENKIFTCGPYVSDTRKNLIQLQCRTRHPLITVTSS